MYSYYNPDLYPYGNYGFYQSADGFNMFKTGVAVSLIILSILLIVAAFSIAMYIFKTIGLYTLASRRNMKNKFLVFIPIVSEYYLGSIADDICLTMNKKTNYARKILILSIVYFVIYVLFLPMYALSAIMLYGGFAFGMFFVLLYLALSATYIIKKVYEYIALYSIFKEYSYNNAVIFEVLSIIFPFLANVFLFVIRNNKSGYEMWLEKRNAQYEQTEKQETEVRQEEPDVSAVPEQNEETPEQNETV